MIDDASVKSLLEQAKTIAIIGAKDTPGQAVDAVGRYLMDAGYEVVPVHPKRPKVWGLQAYPTINDVDRAIDIVDVFRAPEFCAEHARQATLLNPLPKAFWMQMGIRSIEARQILEQGPVMVIEDLCIMREHRRLLP